MIINAIDRKFYEMQEHSLCVALDWRHICIR
ncbi:MAG: hypothetical protein HW387_661 [Parachlamydiales bacterium]|nr:hypothetical protein [Parachlamydiales bacterium]